LGDEDCELKILSYPSILSPDQYRGFYEYMTREIGIAAHKAEEFIVRPMMEKDDIYQIARLIYLTDPYIYPLWFDSMEQGIRIISEMINLPTLYNKDNIMVAVDGNNHIAGITVSCQSPFCEKIDYIKQAFERAGEKMDERSLYIFDNYYALMGKVEDGYYIANVSVDPEFRRRGIAAMLVDEIIKDRDYCTLECIVANSGTWRIYQRLGFKIAYEYPGVCDVPCYKMIYRR
jgi:ribosomal protein S18 acetylase RimI-like enzyme